MKRLWSLSLAIFFLLFSTGCGEFDLDDFAAYYDNEGGPGATIAIFQDGETKYTKSFGYSSVSDKTAITSQTVFPISSMSKHITAACVLKLVEREQLRLDQDILEFFPQLSSFAQGITVADLLNHTSGIPSRSSAATMRGQQIFKYEKEPVDWLVAHGKLEFEPGTKYQYGNTSYYLAAEIVRIVAQKSLQDFAEEEFFSKLGMDDTFFRSYPEDLGANVAMGYAMNEEGEYKERPSKIQYIGAVGVFTTVEDFKKWEEAFHKKELLPAELHARYESSYQLDSGEGFNYAYGLRLDDQNGVKKAFHAGQDYDIGYVSYFARYPEHGLTYVILSNASHFAMSQARGLVEQYIADNQLIDTDKESLATHKELSNNDQWEEAKAQAKLDRSPAELELYAGSYYNENLDANYSLQLNAEGNALEVRVNEIDPVELLWLEEDKAIAASTYHIAGIWLSARAPIFKFTRTDGAISGFQLDGGGTNGIDFIRIPK